jgi:hypothetical protein
VWTSGVNIASILSTNISTLRVPVILKRLKLSRTSRNLSRLKNKLIDTGKSRGSRKSFRRQKNKRKGIGRR